MPAFEIYLIKPTRYDDDGYPLQWWRSLIPSNSLACVAALVQDAIDRKMLGEGVEMRLRTLDEAHSHVSPSAIIDELSGSGARALVCLVGVQSNQFPRALDLAIPFRRAQIPVCIGGFHVSGCLAMLKDLPPEIRQAQALGISLFAGEAEDGRMDDVLADGYVGRLQPVYNHLAQPPKLAGMPTPLLFEDVVSRNVSRYSSFDLGRGCPFECAFCTIINVQGRKSRFRSADDLERIVRENAAIGVDRFFLTDDNFARNRNWETLIDRLIELREHEKLAIRMALQVDTLAYRIPRFIDKLVKAGADQIFIGLESINPQNLGDVKKGQNKVVQYRDMFLAWKRYPVVITCGYIVGLPNDTRASILRDIETIKAEFPIDTLYLNYFTPLPGSETHKQMVEAGIWMDPDLNKYDLNHRVMHHPLMSDEDWEAAYREAHARFYSFAHMEKILKRMVALGSNKKLTTVNRLVAYREAPRLEGAAKLESGYIRIKRRRQRRPGLQTESPLSFYPAYLGHLLVSFSGALLTYVRLRLCLARALRSPGRLTYVDAALGMTDPKPADQPPEPPEPMRPIPHTDERPSTAGSLAT